MLRNQLIAESRNWIGTRFQHQGRIQKSSEGEGGCDCIGLILGLANKFQLKSKLDDMPLTQHDLQSYSKFPQKNKIQQKLEIHLASQDRNVIRPADIGLFSFNNYPQHVGIFNVDNSVISMIHTYEDVGFVSEHSFSKEWQQRLVQVFSFIELA